jgi:hypothetical protein
VTTRTFDYNQLHPTVAAQLRDLASQVNANEVRSTDLMISTGEVLLNAKKGLSHGQFLDWSSLETRLEPKMAQNYMNVARLARKEQDVNLLNQTVAIKIAAPSVPNHVIEKVLSAARRGERVKNTWVDELLGRTKSEILQPDSIIVEVAEIIIQGLKPHDGSKVRSVPATGANGKRLLTELHLRLAADQRNGALLIAPPPLRALPAP